MRNGLGRLTAKDLSISFVAYEPVWSVGTGRTATPEIAAGMHSEIRKTFAEIYGAAAADALRILYGGSVKPDNISALMSKEDIDGALVGGRVCTQPRLRKCMRFFVAVVLNDAHNKLTPFNKPSHI